ncbi:MAG: hypothetical protein PHE27_01020 [Alphaproteobacteria bacterium]|nr:hypothetical protein [Alphaproteobacteria bacterium]
MSAPAYTQEDLEKITKYLKGVEDLTESGKKAELSRQITASITREEQADIQKMMAEFEANLPSQGINEESLVCSIRVFERVYTVAERTVGLDNCINHGMLALLADIRGLEDKHVDILKGLDCPVCADRLEKSITYGRPFLKPLAPYKSPTP